MKLLQKQLEVTFYCNYSDTYDSFNMCQSVSKSPEWVREFIYDNCESQKYSLVQERLEDILMSCLEFYDRIEVYRTSITLVRIKGHETITLDRSDADARNYRRQRA